MTVEACDGLIAQIEALTKETYELLYQDKKTSSIAEDGRLKVLLYFPYNHEQVVLLTFEVQLDLGMKYRIQSLLERTGEGWCFDGPSASQSAANIIRRIITFNRMYAGQRSAVRKFTNIRINSLAADNVNIELLSVETRPIDLWSDGDVLQPKLAIHLLCFYEDRRGRIVTDALFWEVADIDEWRSILDDEVIPAQKALSLRLNATTDE